MLSHMATSLEDTIMEEREEHMLPPTSAAGAHPIPRIAHFLKPSQTSINTPLSNLLPSLSLSSSTTNKRPLKVAFNGWRNPQKDWNTWVDRMHSLHKSTWLKAGIHDAVLNSTFTITRNEDLVLGFTERWCSDTNTFVFPFGEATITLEDVMILGGYSVSGDSVLETTTELEKIQEKLEQARLELGTSRSHKATHYNWMAKFMGSGSEIEHEAFLVLWLARFVFPSASFNSIRKSVYPIAIRFSKGTKVALAPAVLATIYRDLSLLKNAIVDSTTKSEDEDNKTLVTVWASFPLVQVWIWERFPTIRPKPNSIQNGKPRLARWHNLKQVMNIDNARLALESASNNFRWRPYCMAVNTGLSCNFYKEEEEEWVSFDCNNEVLVAFARCLRVSELVGFECTEQYLPHRTAMQFGFDQDLPGHVARANETPKIAWRNYTRPVVDKKLYFPPRLFEADVTTRYFEWWKHSALKETKDARNEKFCSGSTRTKAQSTSDEKGEDNALVPPGFRAKCSKVEAGDPFDEDQLTVAEIVRNRRMQNGNKTLMAEPLQSLISSAADNESVEKVQSSVFRQRVNSGTVMEESERTGFHANENVGTSVAHNRGSVNSKKGRSSVFKTNEPRGIGMDIEARISKLEKEVACLKAAIAIDIGHLAGHPSR